MYTLSFTHKKISDGYQFTIKVKDGSFTVGKININYEYLEEESLFLGLDEIIINNAQIESQFIHEHYSHEAKIYIYTGYKYVDGVLSFFKIEVDDFMKKKNYTDDDITCMLQIKINNKNRMYVAELINYINNEYNSLYEKQQKENEEEN